MRTRAWSAPARGGAAPVLVVLSVLGLLALLTILVGAAGCGGASEAQRNAETRPSGDKRSQSLAGGEQPDDDRSRCDWNATNREMSEYDTTGDEHPDVRKVFLHAGGAGSRLILICREADLNGDGVKDIVRYYNDEGRPMREEADRDFDGQMDEMSYFQDGLTVRQELDTNKDGKVDAKIFYEDGKPVRAERDLAGRSTPNTWRPDRWEYFREGRLVRMGTDVDGDGKVDRWDRNQELYDQFERAEADAEGEAGAGP